MTIKNSDNQKPTLIIYRTEGIQPGWEERLDPTGSGTSFLTEHLSYASNPTIPKVGERLSQFKRLQNKETHIREGDWQISCVEKYSSDNESGEWGVIYICYCQYSPIEQKWEKVPSLEEIVPPDRFVEVEKIATGEDWTQTSFGIKQ